MKKWKLGLLGAVAMAAAMLVPVFLSGAASGAGASSDPLKPALADPQPTAETQYVAFQVGNRYGIKNHSRFTLDGGAKPFIDDAGRVQVPLEAASESIGLSVMWDDVNKIATLTEDDVTATLTVGIPQMTVGDQIIDLPTAPVIQDDNTYIPARALENIGGWQLEFLSSDKGSYIIFKTGGEQDITEEIAQLLGASVEQYLANGLIVRTGSDKAIARGSEIPFSGMTTFDGSTSIYFPLEESVTAMGGSVETADGIVSIRIGDREASLDTVENTAMVDRTPSASEDFAFEELDGAIYVSDDLLAALLGMQKTILDDSILVFTAAPLKGYPDQEEAIAAIGSGLSGGTGLTGQSGGKNSDIPEAEYYVALTFDDGPTGQSEGLTARLLNALAERGAHATFFMCGYRVKDFHAVLDRYLEEGHEMGNHTMDHKNLTKLSVSEIHEQVDDNSELIESYAGAKPTVMRPTGGAYNDTIKAEMEKSGLPIILWSLDTLDWQSKDASSVEKKILNNVQDGDIILMHDLYESTYKGVLNAIDKLKDKGYAFVTVSELAEIKGVELEPGKVYSSFR